MEQTSNEVIKLFRERLKYPIITIYTIILIVYNWDVLAIFFLSNEAIEARIKNINTNFSDPWFTRLWVPLLKAMAISFIAPFLMLILDRVLKKTNNDRTKIKNEKFENSLQVKKKVALLEWDIQEAKTGKKTSEQWESIISDTNNMLQNEQKRSIKLETDLKLASERVRSLDSENVNLKQNITLANNIAEYNNIKLSDLYDILTVAGAEGLRRDLLIPSHSNLNVPLYQHLINYDIIAIADDIYRVTKKGRQVTKVLSEILTDDF